MADVTISDALNLFTKVNTKMLDRIIKLEQSTAAKKQAAKTEPEQVVQKAAPVEVESFGKKAIDDLKKIIGSVQTTAGKEMQKAKKGGLLDWLLGALGLLGAGLAALYDKIKDFIKNKLLGYIDGAIKLLKDCIKSMWGSITKGWNNIKSFFSRSVTRLTDGAKMLADKVKGILDKIKNSNVLKGIKTFFVKVGASVSTFADKLIDGAKSLSQKLMEKFKVVRDALKSLTQKAAETVFGKEGQRTLAGKAVDVTKGAAKAVGGAVVKGAEATVRAGKAVGGAAMKTSAYVRESGAKLLSRGKVIAEVGSKLGGLKFTTSIFQKLLKRVPIIGSLIETYLTNSDIKELVERHVKDPSRYTEDMLYSDIGKRLAEGIGGIAGGVSGATLGAAVGSVIPVGGNIVGAIAGGVAGDWVGRKVFGAIANSISSDTRKGLGKFIYDKIYRDNKPIKGSLSSENIEQIEVEDAAIYPGNNKIIKPHADDSIYAMKDGGPFDKFFTKNIKTAQENNNILKTYAETNNELVMKQVRLLSENNKLLNMLAEKLSTPTNIISKPTVIANNFTNQSSLRMLQGISA